MGIFVVVKASIDQEIVEVRMRTGDWLVLKRPIMTFNGRIQSLRSIFQLNEVVRVE